MDSSLEYPFNWNLEDNPKIFILIHGVSQCLAHIGFDLCLDYKVIRIRLFDLYTKAYFFSS